MARVRLWLRLFAFSSFSHLSSLTTRSTKDVCLSTSSFMFISTTHQRKAPINSIAAFTLINSMNDTYTSHPAISYDRSKKSKEGTPPRRTLPSRLSLGASDINRSMSAMLQPHLLHDWRAGIGSYWCASPFLSTCSGRKPIRLYRVFSSFFRIRFSLNGEGCRTVLHSWMVAMILEVLNFWNPFVLLMGNWNDLWISLCMMVRTWMHCWFLILIFARSRRHRSNSAVESPLTVIAPLDIIVSMHMHLALYLASSYKCTPFHLTSTRFTAGLTYNH